MAKPVYVAVEDEERELLLQLLNVAATNYLYTDEYLNGGVLAERDEAECQGDLTRIDVLCERLESRTPLTRTDIMAITREIDSTLIELNKLRAQRDDLYDRLRARCTNALRLARAGSTNAEE